MTGKHMKPGGGATAFADDADFLQVALLGMVRARVAKLAAVQRLAEVLAEENDGDPAYLSRPGRNGSREIRCRLRDAQDMEATLLEQVASRLEAHRADTSRPMLGIDQLCNQHGLSDDERFALIALTVPVLGKQVCTEIFDSLPDYYGALSVDNLIHLMTPDPGGIADVWQLRKLFRPQAPLRRAGLIIVHMPSSEVGPGDLMAAEVQLSMSAAAIILGDPDMLLEGSPPEPTANTTPDSNWN